jgi:hypothetical protein
MIDITSRRILADPKVITHSAFYDNSEGKGRVEETLYAYDAEGKIQKHHFQGDMNSEDDWAAYCDWAISVKGAIK